MLNYRRTDYLKQELMKHKDNMKQLYKLVMSLTGSVADIHMPKCDSNIELRDHFADFFITKIEENIRSNLDQHLLYQLVVNETTTKLEVFKALSQDDVKM